MNLQVEITTLEIPGLSFHLGDRGGTFGSTPAGEDDLFLVFFPGFEVTRK